MNRRKFFSGACLFGLTAPAVAVTQVGELAKRRERGFVEDDDGNWVFSFVGDDDRKESMIKVMKSQNNGP